MVAGRDVLLGGMASQEVGWWDRVFLFWLWHTAEMARGYALPHRALETSSNFVPVVIESIEV